ncbi:MAG: hypothetical protein E7610_04915 [Ruminococcaceae bacterium]|nr:hypothetical protein [Oscillospiraceae bacterium]
MEQKQQAPIVVSIAGMPKRRQRKVVKRITKEVVKDKQFRRTIRKSEEKIPKAVKEAAVKAAVEATLGTKTGNPVIPPKKSGLEAYTELVGKFAAARRRYNKKKQKAFKVAKKKGYDPQTGLYTLKKADKIKTAKKIKPYKPKKAKK